MTSASRDRAELPVIDIAALFDPHDDIGRARVAAEIAAACRAHGFFYVTGHGVTPEGLEDLERESRAFFERPLAEKMQIEMARGGPAWRGYFPVGGELTSGRPDLKEGLYLGEDLPADDPGVQAGLPLHGRNLWPARAPGLRMAAEAYMAATTRAGVALMEGVALSLGLSASHFADELTKRPTILFRIFHYPASGPADVDWSQSWGVGEHTDYGLLTLLAQDHHGGLEVKTPGGWIAAPPIEGALVCNIGDMLERLTRGRYVSTPHRVLNRSGADRLSFPLFFDPGFDAPIRPLPIAGGEQGAADRWDGADLHAVEGLYGDYLLSKVSKVFPDLWARLMG